jgi:hypothetical protein
VASLTDSTKLQYLKSCLSGQAAELVKNVATTSANYNSTWQALEMRYYNPRAIIAKLSNEFYGITPIARESALDIRRFTDEVLRIHRAFKNLNIPIESWYLWLLDKLSSYLDLESSKLWEAEQSAKDRRWIEETSLDSSGSHIVDRFSTFSEFADFLERRSQTLSMVRVPDNNLSRKRSLPSTGNYHHKRGFHVAPRETCILCDQQHS